VRLVLSIDPGVRGCGCAWWVGEELLHARYVPGSSGGRESGASEWMETVRAVEAASEEALDGLRPDVVVVERMQVYMRGKGDPRDLLALAAIGGGLFRAFGDAEPVGALPREWKGQVPREVMGNRIEQRLRDRGWWGRVAEPRRKANLNDVMHAVGLGLWYGARASRNAEQRDPAHPLLLQPGARLA
jgi:hypothetical protein